MSWASVRVTEPDENSDVGMKKVGPMARLYSIGSGTWTRLAEWESTRSITCSVEATREATHDREP